LNHHNAEHRFGVFSYSKYFIRRITMRDLARSAENVLIPKGDDNKACVAAFQTFTDIEVPTFRGRELVAKSGGRVFWLLKGKDIPGLIAAGRGDVGMTGTDSRIEYDITATEPNQKIRFQKVGQEAMCRFSLLSMQEDAVRMQRMLDSRDTRDPLEVVTGRPNTLQYLKGNLPLTPSEFGVSGSIEAAMQLIGAPLAADLVDSGETARQNGLVEIFKLTDVYPEIVTKGE
jgi:ATP phosphoribosyltransferase